MVLVTTASFISYQAQQANDPSQPSAGRVNLTVRVCSFYLHCWTHVDPVSENQGMLSLRSGSLDGCVVARVQGMGRIDRGGSMQRCLDSHLG